MIPRNGGTNVLLRRTSIAVQGSKPLVGGGGAKVGGDEMVVVVGIGCEVNVLPSMYKEVKTEIAWRWRDRVLSRKGTNSMLSALVRRRSVPASACGLSHLHRDLTPSRTLTSDLAPCSFQMKTRIIHLKLCSAMIFGSLLNPHLTLL